MKSNPFATRFVAPGHVRWIGNGDETVRGLAVRFVDQLGCRAAIVGQHGTGKSTLVEHLLPYLGVVRFKQTGKGQVIEQPPAGNLIQIQLRRSSRPLMQIRRSFAYWQSGGILILDGLERTEPAGKSVDLRSNPLEENGPPRHDSQTCGFVYTVSYPRLSGESASHRWRAVESDIALTMDNTAWRRN